MASGYESTQEHANFAAFSRIVVELLRDCVWKVLEIKVQQLPVKDLRNTLLAYVSDAQRLRLRHDTVGKFQTLLGNTTGTVEQNDCDIGVIYTITRTVLEDSAKTPSPAPAPTQGWGTEPTATDLSIWDDLERIRIIRNSCFGHTPSATIVGTVFQTKLKEIRDIVTRIDNSLSTTFVNGLDEIEEDLKKDKDLLMHYKNYTDTMKELVRHESTNKEKIKKLQQRQKEMGGRIGVLEASEAKRRKLSTEPSSEELKELKRKLMKRYKDKQSEMVIHEVLDEVNVLEYNTPLVVREDLERWLSKSSREKKDSPFRQQGKTETGNPVKSYKEIFFKNNSPQHEIYLLGEAGVGKSTFCLQLVNLWCQLQEKTTDDEYEQFLQSIDYVFYVCCRFAEKSDSVLDMILKQLFSKKDYSLAEKVLFSTPEKCLIVLDGLDEWASSSSGESSSTRRYSLPDMKDVEECTILITSRPWRTEVLNCTLKPSCRVLEIKGLDPKDIVSLTAKILRALGLSVPEELYMRDKPKLYFRCRRFFPLKQQLFGNLADGPVKSFLCQIEEHEMTDIVKIPILLIFTIMAWHSGNQTLDKSKCRIYAGLVESVFSHSEIKLSDKQKEEYAQINKQNTELPVCFKDKEMCTQYGWVIEKLAKIAFDALVRTDKENSLVFTKDQLIRQIGRKELKVCLSLGILSQSKAVSDTIVKKTSISFLHRSVQEFLAALYLCLGDSDLKKFQDSIRNVEETFDFSLVLVFLCGMDIVKGQKMCHHIAEIVSHSVEFENYRKNDFPFYYNVKHVQNLLLQCSTEADIFSSASSQNPQQQGKIIIPDVVIDSGTPTDRVHQLCDLVCSQETATKSLVFEDDTETPLIIVEKLHTVKEIEKLLIRTGKNNANRCAELLCEAIINFKKLQSFGFVVTHNFPVTKSTCVLLVTALGKMPNLQSLRLKGLDLTAATESTLSPPPSCQSLSLDSVSVSSLNLTPTLQSVTLEYLSVSQLVLSELTIPSSLTVLNMLNVRLSSSDWRQLCGYLLHTHLLTKLTLNPSLSDDVVSISDDVVTIYDEVQLKDNQSLQTLYLYNLCLESGLEIPNSSSLTRIIMFSVKMSVECWKSFIHRLNRHPSQQLEVWLHDVNIDEDIVSHIYKYFTVTENETIRDNTRVIIFQHKHRDND